MSVMDHLKGWLDVSDSYDQDDIVVCDEENTTEQPKHSSGRESRHASAKKETPSRSTAADDSWDDLVKRYNGENDTHSAPASYNMSKVVDIRTTAKVQIYVSSPTSAAGIGEAADNLRAKRYVFLNLENTPDRDFYHILYFIAGISFGMGGKFVKISNKTFLATPYDADISGNLVDELKSGSFPIDK